MKKFFFILALYFIAASAFAFTPEIKTFRFADGEKTEGRLCLPGEEVKATVVCIAGTGPSTYLAKRPGFNFYDELANGFCEQGLAFFTYNRRGCTLGDTPPFFVDVDSVKYAKYTPLQEAEDVESLICSLRNDPRFKNSRIILYGLSEGTVIAPLIAERGKVAVDALLLHGYAHDNMFDIIQWQDEGNGVMITVNGIFDRNGDKRISREEYASTGETETQQKKYLFQDMPFDSLDVVKDGFIDVQDIRKMRAPLHEYLLQCIKDDNYSWIRDNYFNITPRWFKAHFELEPNKTRLTRLSVPIYVFHGTDDANAPVESIYDLQARFDACNKTNLHIHVFEKHNHDLNFTDKLLHREWSEGFKKLFETAGNI